MNSRQIIIIASVIIALGAAVGGIYAIYRHYIGIATSPISIVGGFPVADNAPVSGGDTTLLSGSDTKGAVGEVITPDQAPDRIVQVSKGPVVPGMIALDPIGSATSTSGVTIRYIERRSGNIYSYATRTGAITRINNKTLPGIQSATWIHDGSMAYVRYLSSDDSLTLNTYAFHATSTEGFFLPQGLSGIAVSTNRILMLASSASGSSASLTSFDGSNDSKVFSTPLSALRTSFAGPDHYLAFPKPSASFTSAAYLVSRATERWTRIFGPQHGLIALASPSGDYLLVSYNQNGEMRLAIVDTDTAEATVLPVSTLADKCVWALDSATIYCGVPVKPRGEYAYPDDWYQGAVSFSDRVWKIDVDGRYAQLVLDFPSEVSDRLDATALAINPDETVLAFINKNDGSLWAYTL